MAYGEVVASDGAAFLKFKRGVYLFGMDEEELPTSSRLVANMAELKAGFLKWDDGQVIEEKMRHALEGLPPPRAECGDEDETEWPLDPNGTPKDPWSATSTLPFKNLDTGQEYVFSTSSQGGRGAMGKLALAYGRQRDKKVGKLPIVEIGASSYFNRTHKTDVDVPTFKIVDWLSDEELLAGKTESAVEDDLADEIPF